jgi:hypothetical protein
MVGGGGGGEIAGCGWSSRAILRPSCASRSVASRSRVATRRARRAARASDMDTAIQASTQDIDTENFLSFLENPRY